MDKEFEKWGFPQDKNRQGVIVDRDATISQEVWQQAKCLSHAFYTSLCKERIDKIQALDESKKAAEDDKLIAIHGVNKQCKDRLKTRETS